MATPRFSNKKPRVRSATPTVRQANQPEAQRQATASANREEKQGDPDMNSDLASDPAYEWSDWTAKQLQTFTLSVEEPLPIRDPKHSHRALLTTSSERIDVLVALEEMGSAINESEIYPTGYENEFEIIRMTPAKWDDMIKLVKSDKLKKLPGSEEPHITPPAEYSEYDDLSIVL